MCARRLSWAARAVDRLYRILLLPISQESTPGPLLATPFYLFMLLAIRNLITNITAAFGMSENAPPGPGGAPATVNASADVSRGVPYYEKIRRDLKDTIQKKRILDQNLVHLSVQRILAEKLELTM